MNYTNILEEFIGSFWGAFFAFFSGILLNSHIEQIKQKHELKRFFGLLDRNQESIDRIWRLLNQGIEQENLMRQIMTIRDSSDPKHKLCDIKTQGINFTLEICEHCKKNGLHEEILHQIDFQDKVIQLLCGLYELSDDDLQRKLESSTATINNMIRNMEININSWRQIKANLKKLKLIHDL